MVRNPQLSHIFGSSITVKAPHDLKALLATMVSAKTQGVHMAIWDRDIKTVEEAIATIEGVRSDVSGAVKP